MAFHRTAPPLVEHEYEGWIFIPREAECPEPRLCESEDDGFSGLYDANEEPLYRQKRRIGFEV